MECIIDILNTLFDKNINKMIIIFLEAFNLQEEEIVYFYFNSCKLFLITHQILLKNNSK